MWHLGRREHPDDEDRRGNEIEEPVREHRADERAQGGSSRAVRREGDAGAWRPSQAPEPPRERGIREETDAERRQDVDEARLILGGKRLADRQPPREGAEDRGDDVEEEGEDDPAPDDVPEGFEDAPPLRPSPPDEDERKREERGHRRALEPPAPERAQDGHAARAAPCSMPVTCS